MRINLCLALLTSWNVVAFRLHENRLTLAPGKVSPPFRSTGTILSSSTDTTSKEIETEPICTNFNFPTQLFEIKEKAALDMISKMQRANIVVPDYISKVPVASSYVRWEANTEIKGDPVVLIHGFDSSALEFRRMSPLLTTGSVDNLNLGESGRDVYVVDVLGWGFGDCSEVMDVSPQAKMDHLRAFIEQVVLPDREKDNKKKSEDQGTSKVVLAGASLGGAIAINLATEICPELVSKLVLIDAQGFIDGQGPSSLPMFVARWGVSVLKTKWLRQLANQLSYFDKKTFATEDAMLIGRLPCNMPSWERSNAEFLLSGGFVVSPNVPRVQVSTLVVWGRQDEILENSFPGKFEEALGTDSDSSGRSSSSSSSSGGGLCRVHWVEECGHVPHLEKPTETAKVIHQFLLE
eukprot:CAMPEP_0174962104 /NCGR_PEP_ID=MMETSP0004_2-20121128/4604_1 /TAXON_ID=420556 /ORGANISM="Ochromonas sp., Strain CCMP1393" /LENGTH=406 /DNA_ID=CAMNT_0016210611 /DNA_START=30 /DNA_END=1250 /DNA_ORIENTATION=+